MGAAATPERSAVPTARRPKSRVMVVVVQCYHEQGGPQPGSLDFVKAAMLPLLTANDCPEACWKLFRLRADLTHEALKFEFRRLKSKLRSRATGTCTT